MKYKEWLGEWLEHYVKSSSKERTFIRYTDIVKKHLFPTIGEYELSELSPLILQRFIAEMLQSGNINTGAGLSSNTVNSFITVIQGSLKMAHSLGLTDKYIADKIRRPRSKEKSIECFSVTEQKQIEKAVLEDKRVKMIGVILCLYTGLRIGELLALEWPDIDFSKGELSVNKSCYDSNIDGKFCRATDTPKTEASIRVIPVPKQLIPLLKQTKKKNRSKWVVGDGKKIIYVRSYQYSFQLMLKKLKIPCRGFHALRHTFATRALECGMDVKTLSEILGHNNPTVTLNRYAHSLLSHKHDVMDKLGK